MNFGSLSAEQRIRILLELVGGPKYAEQMHIAGLRTRNLARQTEYAGNAALRASRKTFLWNQAMFTLRRYAFYATLGVTALVGEVIRLGFTYESTMQKAKTTLLPFFGSKGELNRNMNSLFALAAATPFQFQDITKAFATMFQAFQPLGITAKTTRDTLLGISNALVVSQRFTPAAISKVSLALQHMAYQGKITGYQVTQLARDGIPIFEVLSKKLHMTGEEIHAIGKLGIPTNIVLKAMNELLLGDPKYKGQAFRSQTATLSGAFSTFKDLLSQAASSKTGGLFSFAQKFFRNVDKSIMPLARAGKPVTMDQFVAAIDRVLSPKTHSVLMFFQFFTGILNGFIFAIRTTTLVITNLLKPLNYMMNLFTGGSGRGNGAKVIGYALGMLFFIGIIRRAILAIKLLTTAIRIEAATEIASVLFNPSKIKGLLDITRLLFWEWRANGVVSAYKMAAAMVTLRAATLGWVTLLIAAVTALVILDRKTHFLRQSASGNTQSHGSSFGGHLATIAGQSLMMGPTIYHKIAGQFDGGGTVPGPRGSRQFISAHGGETILPTHKMGSNDIFNPIIPVTVMLDGKKVGEVIAKRKADAAANR